MCWGECECNRLEQMMNMIFRMTNNVENGIFKHQRAYGPATVLAIGKAVPPTAYPQSEYPDFFFDITNTRPISKSNLLKFARIRE
ncbi:hypothetical protein R1sor_012829 [Riccia sorocarpa]|uniref:Chalcone/stilbene synthase N-terminal domain-containing protein n=1 Tax=Riccia sorocarpa TaxID=122646 RepID=A0ABD3I593_9MARC